MRDNATKNANNPFIAGVENLVRNCAEVASGERVLIINGHGRVEPALARLIEEEVKAAGAESLSIWIDPISKTQTELPEELVRAMESADKMIFNVMISRVLLNRYLADRDVVEINNYYPTTIAMSATDARFDWRELRRMFTEIERIFLSAKEWTITTSDGTDLKGGIAASTGVSEAFFSKPGASLRRRRVFPGEVYSPVGVVGTEGTVAVQYINELDNLVWDRPVPVIIRADRVVALGGNGPHRVVLEQLLNEKQRTHGDKALTLDSWHGGMHPDARVPTEVDRTIEGARTGPALMHVHLGSQLDTISAGMLFARVEVDGEVLFDRGRCVMRGASKR